MVVLLVAHLVDVMVSMMADLMDEMRAACSAVVLAGLLDFYFHLY
jgi:hypothetical protein